MGDDNKVCNHLFEHSGTAIATLNSKGIFLSVNALFKTLSGYSQNELINKENFINFVSGKSLSEIKAYLKSSPLNSDAPPAMFECKFINRQGYHSLVALALNWVAEENIFIATLIDISKIKKMQRQFLNAEQREIIAKIGSGVAHEMRNPLAAIITSVEILRDSLELVEQDQELIHIICEEIMNLKEIIKEFSQFTRIEDSKYQIADVNSIIIEALKSIDLGKFNKTVDLCKDLPNIPVDLQQMKSAISKIVLNAVEAMPEGGKLKIRSHLITNKFQEKQIEILVQDSGVGIEEQDMIKLFRPFFSSKTGHVGLGLAYCDRIIYYHSGEIKIESEAGKGTKVFIYLPV